jgi:hypothetical protein
MSLLSFPTLTLFSAFCAEPERPDALARQRAAQVRASLLTGEWGWVFSEDLSAEDRTALFVGIARWVLHVPDLDTFALRYCAILPLDRLLRKVHQSHNTPSCLFEGPTHYSNEENGEIVSNPDLSSFIALGPLYGVPKIGASILVDLAKTWNDADTLYKDLEILAADIPSCRVLVRSEESSEVLDAGPFLIKIVEFWIFALLNHDIDDKVVRKRFEQNLSSLELEWNRPPKIRTPRARAAHVRDRLRTLSQCFSETEDIYYTLTLTADLVAERIEDLAVEMKARHRWM